MAFFQTRRQPSANKVCCGNGTTKRLQLLWVDDHKIALDAFRLYASAKADFRVRGLLNDRIRPSRRLRRTHADVVIINMRMQNPDGATAAKWLLSAAPQAKVIGVGDLQNHETVLSMLRAGASGFVSHTSTLGELLRAVRTVVRGRDFLSPKISRLILDDYKSGARTGQGMPPSMLTDSERRMLALISDGRSNKEMASKINVSVRTVEKYREQLMRKLHIKSVAGLTKFAIRAGIASLD